MDLTINIEGYKLNIRAAVIIIHNNKILVHKNINSDHCTLIGGRVEIGEDSESTVKREVQEELNKEIEIEGALLTMYDIRTNLSNQVVKEVSKYFENRVYKTVIPRNVRLSEAPSYGMPISVYDPRSKGAKSYDKFVKEFLKYNEANNKGKHAL